MKVLNKEKLVELIVNKEGIDEGTRYTIRKCTENTKSFRFGEGAEENKVYVTMGMNEYFITYDFYKEMLQSCLIDVEDTVENREKYLKLGYVFETIVDDKKKKK